MVNIQAFRVHFLKKCRIFLCNFLTSTKCRQHVSHKEKWHVRVFLKCFQWISCLYSKRAGTCHPAISCVRKQYATSVPARHIYERQDLQIESNSCFSDLSHSLNCWHHWLNETVAPFRKNFNEFQCCVLNYFYRPQRSWAKVMFLQASVILSIGGGSASVHAGMPAPPDQADPPGTSKPPPPTRQIPPPAPGRPPGTRDPPPQTRQTPPRPETPPQTRQTPLPPPPRKQTPAYGQWAAGTHPTGMRSCSIKCRRKTFKNWDKKDPIFL